MEHRTQYAVITADVVGSRRVELFGQKRDRKLREAAGWHLREKLILSEYAVTAWDEFQGILRKPEYLPRVIFDLRRLFFPMQLWIAVGVGTVTGAHRQPINKFAGGEAFERARAAADYLKAGSGRFPLLTRCATGDASFDDTANTIYGLQDTLLRGVTAKQWETINRYMQSDGQEEAARRLGLTASTVSRNLKRAHYWQFETARETLEKLLKQKFQA
jgi:SatD family (SatD)